MVRWKYEYTVIHFHISRKSTFEASTKFVSFRVSLPAIIITSHISLTNSTVKPPDPPSYLHPRLPINPLTRIFTRLLQNKQRPPGTAHNEISPGMRRDSGSNNHFRGVRALARQPISSSPALRAQLYDRRRAEIHLDPKFAPSADR